MTILMKYSHNTPATCHFLIKNNNKIKKNYKKLKKLKKLTKILFFIFYFLFFIFYFLFLKKMGVWGGIISQPRPDLPDTLPITVCLQRRDDRFYSPARRVPIRNHQLPDLG
jgi:hypothetical protein